MLSDLRDLWRVASRPLPFFTKLSALEPNLVRAGRAGFLAVTVGLLSAGVAALRFTTSDAYLPLFFGLLLTGWFNWLLIWGLGGLLVLRPAQLDLRAWELTAWGWAPAGVLGLSLLPAILLAPLLSLILGYFATLVWNLVLLDSGLRVFAPTKRVRALTWYVLGVVIAPWLLFGLLLFLLTPRGV